MSVEEVLGKMKKGEKTKRKLLDSAGELLKRYEVNEITVDAIVEAAGVAKGTFYIYYESKDALIAALIDNYISSLDLSYKAHLDALPDGTKASDMLLSLIEKITDLIVNSIGYDMMRAAYKMQLGKIINTDRIKGYDRALYNMFADVLRKGVEQGEFNNALLVGELTKHFVMAIRGLCYEWCIRYPDFDLQKQALVHFKILLHGIMLTEPSDMINPSLLQKE